MILKNIFKKKISQDQLAILSINEGLKVLQTHLIALARLQFVKPETLVREANNIKSNGEYLTKMVEEISKNANNKK
jgi:hypothetical protein